MCVVLEEGRDWAEDMTNHYEEFKRAKVAEITALKKQLEAAYVENVALRQRLEEADVCPTCGDMRQVRILCPQCGCNAALAAGEAAEKDDEWKMPCGHPRSRMNIDFGSMECWCMDCEDALDATLAAGEET
jgi:ribosomal protein L32